MVELLLRLISRLQICGIGMHRRDSLGFVLKVAVSSLCLVLFQHIKLGVGHESISGLLDWMGISWLIQPVYILHALHFVHEIPGLLAEGPAHVGLGHLGGDARRPSDDGGRPGRLRRLLHGDEELA